MTRVRAVRIASLLGVLVACKRAPPAARETTQADADVPSTLRVAQWAGLQLHVPADADSHGGPDRFELARRPHTRTPDTMSLRRSTADEHAALLRTAPKKVVLDGGRLAYRVERSEGGSGGPEATLVGAVELGAGTYRVECHAQSEDAPPAGDWCLPYLLTLGVSPSH